MKSQSTPDCILDSRMRVLRRQGMNKTYIAQKVEVSEDSVRRYTCDIAPAVRGKALSAKDVTGLLMGWN